MQGVRLVSFAGSHKLLRGVPNTWCHKKSTTNFGHRRFHYSALRFSTDYNNAFETLEQRRKKIATGPGLSDFIQAHTEVLNEEENLDECVPYIDHEVNNGGREVYFEIYGCQMNTNDTEVVWSILKANGYKRTFNMVEADVVLIVTCSIRESAEQKVWNKLNYLQSLKAKRNTRMNKFPMKIGILGCMAARLKNKMLETKGAVDIIAGPDSYKDLPRLLQLSYENDSAVNVALSPIETYADIMPVRLKEDSISSFVTIMRGCDNMCTYCIVPFTRGKERSRPISSILNEVQHLSDQGVKEVTLLGQNVNSYRDLTISNFYTGDDNATSLAKGFKTVYKNKLGGLRFSDLLDKVSLVNPEMRIRFTAPHPKDFPDEVLHLIAERSNICQQLHLPAQSGNSAVLERMRRGYTREAYLELVDHVRSIIPNVALSSDFITGFCGETEEEFKDTLTLVDRVQYNKAYLFAYSMRKKTTAYRRFEDDVASATKKERLWRLGDLYKRQAEKLNRQLIGTQQLVLIEGESRRTSKTLMGRNDGNTRVIIPNAAIPANRETDQPQTISPGDYVVVQIINANMNTLMGVPLYHSSISSCAPQLIDL